MFLTIDFKPVNSQAFASQLSSRSDNWSPITWYQPTADSTSDPVATGDSTGVSMATEVWSRTVTQSRSLLERSTASSYRRQERHCVCVCVCLSYVAMVIGSGQCQERLERAEDNTAESTFKQLLTDSTRVNHFKNTHLLSWLHLWEQIRKIPVKGFFFCVWSFSLSESRVYG